MRVGEKGRGGSAIFLFFPHSTQTLKTNLRTFPWFSRVPKFKGFMSYNGKLKQTVTNRDFKFIYVNRCTIIQMGSENHSKKWGCCNNSPLFTPWSPVDLMTSPLVPTSSPVLVLLPVASLPSTSLHPQRQPPRILYAYPPPPSFILQTKHNRFRSC